jgi:hypothetical protein
MTNHKLVQKYIKIFKCLNKDDLNNLYEDYKNAHKEEDRAKLKAIIALRA